MQQCIDDAQSHKSKCTPEVLSLEGMSSAKVRHLLNNLCSHPRASYLEIGAWKGATLCAAVCKNEINPLAIDNFSEFGGTLEQFRSNCQSTIGRIPDLLLTDFHEWTAPTSRRFNILYYDASHSYDDQRAAIVQLAPALEPVFLLIVDDWNWEQVRAGTMQGIREARISVLQSWALPAEYPGDPENWWNGLFVALCRRPVSLSIIVPSTGRHTLTWTLESFQGRISHQDEVIVVFDRQDGIVPALIETVENVSSFHTVVLPGGPKNDFGAMARTVGMRLASRDLIAFIDDDDLYHHDALAVLRRAGSSEPHRPHLFRMSRHPYGTDLWQSPNIREGNVSTQMFLAPNRADRLGAWTSRYCGDYDFIRSTVELYPGGEASVMWHEDVIVSWNGAHALSSSARSIQVPPPEGNRQRPRTQIPNNYQILSEIDDLVDEVRRRNPRSVLEVGSLEGYTLSRWSEVLGPGAMIVSIDLLVPGSDARFATQLSGHRGGWARLASVHGHSFYMLSGSSRDQNMISRAEALAPFEFIFIDGDHSYDGVRADWENYFPMLAPGGIVAFHDIASNEPNSGVHMLWNEIKAGFTFREILHCPNGTKGIGILEKRAETGSATARTDATFRDSAH